MQRVPFAGRLHFWANDDPVTLAAALRAALDLTNSAPAMAAAATR